MPTPVVQAAGSLYDLPDEVLLIVLHYLDIPELLVTSRASHRLRALSLDPLLHRLRLKSNHARVDYLLPRRPAAQKLQPPASTILLNSTHLAARRLHWSLVSIRLNRSLQRRPKLSTLVSRNILPKECCKLDRRSGDFVWGVGVAGPLVERRRQLERERLKQGLRVWLERKAREIRTKKDKGVGVGALVWRFSKRLRFGAASDASQSNHCEPRPKKDRVSSLKRYWESIGNDSIQTPDNVRAR